MPSNLGSVSISNISGSSIVEFGDTVFISPKSASKYFLGSGSSSSGAFLSINNGVSITNTVDSNLINQPVSTNE